MNPIGWCDETWNPMTGCTHVSEACDHCYAHAMACRFDDHWGYTKDGHGNFWPRFHPDRLDVPLHWRKPRRIFVCSMSDLFHEAFTDEERDVVFVTMALAWRHTFMVLTKRPGRMHRYLLDGRERITEKASATGRYIEATWTKAQLLTAYARTGAEWEASENAWPLPNLWLGVTAENQARADERIPILLDTPAAVRFVSVEPMLGPVKLDRLFWPLDQKPTSVPTALDSLGGRYGVPGIWQGPTISKLDWVILGGENGPGARPMQPEWAHDLWAECAAAGIPFYFKQWGTSGRYTHLLNGYEYIERTRELPEVTP